jgi:hypothetical protein
MWTVSAPATSLPFPGPRKGLVEVVCRHGIHDVLMDAVPDLRQALANEYRRVAQPPWEIPTVLVTNGALMVAA